MVQKNQKSLYHPAWWRVVILGILTGGLYVIYWYSKSLFWASLPWPVAFFLILGMILTLFASIINPGSLQPPVSSESREGTWSVENLWPVI